MSHPLFPDLGTDAPQLLKSRRSWLGSAAACVGATLTSSWLGGCGGGDSLTPGPSVQLRRHNALKAVAHAAVDARPTQLAGLACGWSDATMALTAMAGLRRVGSSAVLTEQDVLIVGSLTKAMTSATAGMLVDEGRLRWDLSLAEGLPEFAGTMHPNWRAVTLAHLLDCRSGIAAFTDGADFDPLIEELGESAAHYASESARRAVCVDWLLRQAPVEGHRPGERYAYSNGGYVVAGQLIEAVTGQTFKAQFNRLMSTRLGIEGSWQHPERLSTHSVLGHTLGARGLEVLAAHVPQEQDWLDVMAPGGLYATSVLGYGRWLDLHAQAMRGQSTPLPQSYLQRLRSGNRKDYRLGWIPLQVQGRDLWLHDGHWFGFRSIAGFDAAGRMSCHALTNTGGEGPEAVMEQLFLRLLSLGDA